MVASKVAAQAQEVLTMILITNPPSCADRKEKGVVPPGAANRTP